MDNKTNEIRLKLTEGAQKYIDRCKAALDSGEWTQTQFDEHKQQLIDFIYREFYNLNLLMPGQERAEKMHQRVEEEIERLKQALPDVFEKISCGKGCSFCCHQFVGVSRSEGAHLYNKYKNLVDWELVTEQASWEPEVFNKKWPKSRCTFLGAQGQCQVYDDRPMVCRSILSMDDPQKCDLSQTQDQEIQAVNIALAELVISAAQTLEPVMSLSQALLIEKTTRQADMGPESPSVT